jgi:peroxidase
MNGLDSIFLGLLSNMSSITSLSMADSLRNHLFNSPNFLSNLQLDLAAANINRGRDHGIPSYNEYRNYCGLGLAKTFADLSNTMSKQNIEQLKSVYNDVNDIDLWVGGLAEGAFVNSNDKLDSSLRHGGAVVGATFACLLRKQFDELKQADRFYYENKPDANKGTDATAFSLGNIVEFFSWRLNVLIGSNIKILLKIN